MKKSLNIIIVHGNSQGLLNDALILEEALYASENVASVIRLSKFDNLFTSTLNLAVQYFKSVLPDRKLIVVHLEEIYREFIHLSATHLLFPNQEWFRSQTANSLQRYKDKITVCCKTRYAEKLFLKLTPNVTFTGFSSIDKFDPDIKKESLSFLHIAGKSEQKGTNSLIKAWEQHPEWPQLTIISRREEHKRVFAENIRVISHFISDEELKLQMNKHPVHLCPSESEGFGHTIWEGYSTNAYVISTDAPPMNEFIEEKQTYSFACSKKGYRYLSELFEVSDKDVRTVITALLSKKQSLLQTGSSVFRQHFLHNKKAFEHRIKKLTEQLH